ncbi:hypothetical protein [Shewanella saliphila]|uniref:Lipoprotein n=1 Tax=Shewanella saliphila TaxID=2282698 RepID=A0ABQ2Q529_9GAMM|nr:hypothetical protein [Shewanella saliphila]MCL1101613.1 hypothetical protein [Shewanella saliphila]GGP51678.1 hypothetical protein GCM10009409_17680 [Shewanella saliphila]
MKHILIMLGLLSLSLQGCQHQVTEAQASKQTAEVATKPIIKDCGPSAMPPIRDRSKLIVNLRAKGIITDDMDQAQIDKTVADYIAKRQKAFEKCHKPTPNTGKS